jgi:Helix-turn-helix.
MEEDLRNKLIKLKETKGTPYSFVADKIGISRAAVSLFVSRKRKIPVYSIDKLIKFLDESL